MTRMQAASRDAGPTRLAGARLQLLLASGVWQLPTLAAAGVGRRCASCVPRAGGAPVPPVVHEVHAAPCWAPPRLVGGWASEGEGLVHGACAEVLGVLCLRLAVPRRMHTSCSAAAPLWPSTGAGLCPASAGERQGAMRTCSIRWLACWRRRSVQRQEAGQHRQGKAGASGSVSRPCRRRSAQRIQVPTGRPRSQTCRVPGWRHPPRCSHSAPAGRRRSSPLPRGGAPAPAGAAGH